jgi:hypothetical protein
VVAQLIKLFKILRESSDGGGLIDLLIGSVFVTIAGMALMNKVATISIDQKKLAQRLVYYNVAQSVSSALASMPSNDLYNLLFIEEDTRGESLGVGLGNNEQEWITHWKESSSGISEVYVYIKVYKSLTPKLTFDRINEISSGDELKEYHKEIIAEVVPKKGPTVEHTVWVEQEL